MKAVAILTIVLFCVSCGSSFGRRVENRFPSQAKLNQMTQKTDTDYLEKQKPGKFVETWELKGPLPTSYGPVAISPSDPIGQLAQQQFQTTPSLKFTESMTCAAREYASFYMVHDKLPFQSLRQFIGSRCGSTAKVQIVPNTFASAQPAEFVEKNKTNLTQFFDSFKQLKRDSNIGLHFVSDEKRSVLIVAYEQPSARITPASMVAQPGGLIVVEGELTDGNTPEQFYGILNKGRFDVGECEAQPVTAPKFKFVCKSDPNDPFTYVQLSYSRPNALFLEYVGRVMVFPSAETNIYAAPATRQILEAAQASGDEYQQLETLINQVRSSAGRTAMKVDRPQSEELQKLAPAFFDANTKNVEDSNTLVMGMLAGWKVTGEIVSADFTSNYIDAPSPQQLIESVLESPHGRKTLLSPTASVFGFGALQNQSNGMASVFVSYDFMPKEHSNKRIKTVLEALNAKRKVRGKPPASEVIELRALAQDWAEDLEEGAAIESIATKQQQAHYDEMNDEHIQTEMFLAADLKNIPFSSQMLDRASLKPSIVVAPYRPDNSPWTFYAVVITY